MALSLKQKLKILYIIHTQHKEKRYFYESHKTCGLVETNRFLKMVPYSSFSFFRYCGNVIFGGKVESFHPYTGFEFRGFKVPYYEEAVKMIKKFHRANYGISSSGRDIAI